MRQIGIYPGTFDPIHRGHVDFAIETMKQCGLDEVIFLAEHRPRNKQKVTNINHRLAMIERVILEIPQLKVLDLQQDQFTVRETLPLLNELYPDTHLTFLIGTDVARHLSTWEDLASLIHEVSFAIGKRSEDNINEIISIVEDIEKSYKSVIVYTTIDTQSMSITSSQIRKNTNNQTLFYPKTLTYIKQHGLYT